MWAIITQISTAITLVAFIVAAGVSIYGRSIKRDEKIIEAADSEQAVQISAAILDTVTIKTDDLTKAQRFELALKTLQNRARRLRYTLITTIVVTVLGTVIALYSLHLSKQIPDADQTIKSGEIEKLEEFSIMPSEAFLSSEDELINLRYLDYDFVLYVNFTVKFENDKYNTDRYIEVVSSLRGELDDGMIYRDSDYLNNDTTQNNETPKEILVIESSSQLATNEIIQIEAGPYKFPIKLTEFNWNEHKIESYNDEKKISRYVAYGTLEVLIPDPDWPNIEEARIVRGFLNNPDKLDIIIYNHTKEDLFVRDLKIDAEYKLFQNVIYSCVVSIPSPVQGVYLDIDSTESKLNSQGSWTKIGEHKYKVVSSYSKESCGGDGYTRFTALVPVDMKIPSNKKKRVTLKLSSSTSEEIDTGLIYGLRARESVRPIKENRLTKWEFWLTLNSTEDSQPIYPRYFSVSVL